MKIGSFVRVANLDELKGARPFAVSANGIDVVVVRTRPGLSAFEASFGFDANGFNYLATSPKS